MTTQIETYIKDNLSGEMRQTALDFVTYLATSGLTFYKDTCACWKDKIYYWVKRNDECVCFIAIKDPDEPDNLWTVWSDGSSAYEDDSVSDAIKNVGWKYVDHCGNCGSCEGGKRKVIFGKIFERVCGCTFRVDNAVQDDFPFLKKMVDLRMRELAQKRLKALQSRLAFTMKRMCRHWWMKCVTEIRGNHETRNDYCSI